ncbi:hypothetical protein BH23GEM6_BH23GEM6_27580 [soil metagenome]
MAERIDLHLVAMLDHHHRIAVAQPSIRFTRALDARAVDGRDAVPGRPAGHNLLQRDGVAGEVGPPRLRPGNPSHFRIARRLRVAEGATATSERNKE